jgi:phosphoribosylaminoimidazolecarboxamide formyltransferase/IMP cyclohydrolase
MGGKMKENGKIALLSVYQKTGIVEFAKSLVSLGWRILASGGTARTLSEAGIAVQDVASLVGGQAILGHRVVTLSREVHAGLLARKTEDDAKEMEQLGIPYIDLVCVDLYPLHDELRRPGSTMESVIEKTDIGGPTMLRSAAKGRRIVICDPADRQFVIDWLKKGRPDEDKVVSALCAKAEYIVSEYCLASARYHSNEELDGLMGARKLVCKYGENGYQTPAGFYSSSSDDILALDKFEQVAGDSPSYNNLCDIDRLLQTVTHIASAFAVNLDSVPNIAVAVKHGNPCGASAGNKTDDVLRKMIIGDRRAIFGGLVMTNFHIGAKEAGILLTYQMDKGKRRLLDGIIAPSFDQEAVKMLERKGDKCRFICNMALANLGRNSLDLAARFRYVRGGFLKQPNYSFVPDLRAAELEKVGRTSERDYAGILLAWAIGSTSNSNTVTLVKSGYLIGNGTGQQDRVGGCKLAISRAKDAGHETKGAIAYSDSFFPFTDGPQALAKAGIKTIFASSGSVMDKDVKSFCMKKKISLVLVPDKMGRGFFGH